MRKVELRRAPPIKLKREEEPVIVAPPVETIPYRRHTVIDNKIVTFEGGEAVASAKIQDPPVRVKRGQKLRGKARRRTRNVS